VVQVPQRVDRIAGRLNHFGLLQVHVQHLIQQLGHLAVVKLFRVDDVVVRQAADAQAAVVHNLGLEEERPQGCHDEVNRAGDAEP
jgi:hypothetical protein